MLTMSNSITMTNTETTITGTADKQDKQLFTCVITKYIVVLIIVVSVAAKYFLVEKGTNVI